MPVHFDSNPGSVYFNIHPDYMDIGCPIFQSSSICFVPGVTVLVGCNGMGKTTLLHQIRDSLKRSEIPVISFNNLSDGADDVKGAAALRQDWQLVSTVVCSSEGENIVIALGEMARKIGAFCRENAGAPNLFFLFDAVDSGLSIDNICEVKKYLFDFLIRENPDSNIYIITAANSYEMARNEDCLNVYSGLHCRFADYESYRDFILESRQIKDQRTYSK